MRVEESLLGIDYSTPRSESWYLYTLSTHVQPGQTPYNQNRSFQEHTSPILQGHTDSALRKER
jgi:hypothetical protein